MASKRSSIGRRNTVWAVLLVVAVIWAISSAQAEQGRSAPSAVGTQAAKAETRPVPIAICDVFKRHCAEALRVSWCESRFKTTARNGQYLGIFQMGSWERRTFGHGKTAGAQARAAYRYFVRTGRDWSPWACKP